MKKLIIFYSFTGHTRKLAKELAKNEASVLYEVEDVKKVSVGKAYTYGCLQAMRGREMEILPIKTKLSEYEEITIMGPIWAGYPAPQIYSIIKHLPAGKRVRVILLSGSGKSKAKKRVVQMLKEKGCLMESFTDKKQGE